MSDFNTRCSNAVQRFLNTVVIIDDEPTYSSLTDSSAPNDASTIQSPMSGIMTANVSSDFREAGLGDIEGDLDSSLDAQSIVNGFADKGIICCIQSPKRETDVISRAMALAREADILILDWVLHGDRTVCKDIIKKTIEEDQKYNGRARLIVVYTAQKNLTQILADVYDEINPLFTALENDRRNFTLMSDLCQIKFINKVSTKDPEPNAKIVQFDVLPDFVISSFCDLVKGLMPCSTMHAISAVREQTHRLISLLGSHLDGVFCAHRALILAPEDSVNYALNLISKEVEIAIVSDKQARDFLGLENITAWADYIAKGKRKLPSGNETAIGIDLIKECLSNGVDKVSIEKDSARNWLATQIRKNQKIYDQQDRELSEDEANEKINELKLSSIRNCKFYSDNHFHDVFYRNQEDSNAASRELARLCCTAKDCSGRITRQFPPMLSLGTIIQDVAENAFYLCLQPPCDSLRLHAETNFLFIKLYNGSLQEADFVIKLTDGSYKHFLVKKPKTIIQTIPFSPVASCDRIIAQYAEDEWSFESGNGTRYKWLAELRYEKSQSIAHHVGWNTSRIGFDEFELLRRAGRIGDRALN